MAKQEYKVLGVMSGTSLDGVDIALVTLTKTNVWSFKINKLSICVKLSGRISIELFIKFSSFIKSKFPILSGRVMIP